MSTPHLCAPTQTDYLRFYLSFFDLGHIQAPVPYCDATGLMHMRHDDGSILVYEFEHANGVQEWGRVFHFYIEHDFGTLSEAAYHSTVFEMCLQNVGTYGEKLGGLRIARRNRGRNRKR